MSRWPTLHPCSNTPVLEDRWIIGRLRISHKTCNDWERVVIVTMTIHVINYMTIENGDVRRNWDVEARPDLYVVIIADGGTTITIGDNSNKLFITSSRLGGSEFSLDRCTRVDRRRCSRCVVGERKVWVLEAGRERAMRPRELGQNG